MEARRRNEEKRLEGNTYLRKSDTLTSEQDYKNVKILVFFKITSTNEEHKVRFSLLTNITYKYKRNI